MLHRRFLRYGFTKSLLLIALFSLLPTTVILSKHSDHNSYLSGWKKLLSDYMSSRNLNQDFGKWLLHSNARDFGLKPYEVENIARVEDALINYANKTIGNKALPAAAFSIRKDGAPFLSIHHGINENSELWVASVTKLFTSVGILMLKEDGVIRSLDENIGKYFPELPFAKNSVNGVPVTIRYLMQHLSGLPWQATGQGIYLKSPHRNMGAFISRQTWPAGSHYFYSNLNYYILACLIEKLSGMSYPDFIQKRIFDPLHMNHSMMLKNSTGAAGLVTSVNDMALFADALFNPERSKHVLNEAAVDEIAEPPEYFANSKAKNGVYYGLGAFVLYQNGVPVQIYHTGDWHGTFAEIRYYTREHAILTQIANPPSFRSKYVARYKSIIYNLSDRYLAFIQQVTDKTMLPQEPADH